MKKNKGTLIAVIVILILIIAGGVYYYTQIQPAKNNNTGNENTTIAEGPKNYVVEILSTGFSPAEITIKQNDIVTWVNKDSVFHSVNSDIGNSEMVSMVLPKDKNVTHTFTTIGTFGYHSTLNPTMKSKIIVK